MRYVIPLLVLLLVLTWAVPAAGGPDPGALASKALKRAKVADDKADEALDRAELGLRQVQAQGTILPGQADFVLVMCPRERLVVSGGWMVVSGSAKVFLDRKVGNGWAVGVDNLDAVVTPAEVSVFALCAADDD